MIKYFILDVDGTLTDGGIYYGNNNLEIKKFCTKDGSGIACARAAGINIIVLTGRECEATTRRMKELHIDQVVQGVKNKVEWLKNWLEDNEIGIMDVGYIGDDINDLGPMKMCGFIGCPKDACIEVKEVANCIADFDGGYGAVRDVIEKYLREVGIWEKIVNEIFDAGI